MTTHRGPRPPRSLASTAALLGVLLAGCGAPASAPADGTTTDSPTAACPEPVTGEAPEGCATYDPERLTSGNEQYRQRRDLPEDAVAASEALVSATTASLERLRVAGPVSQDDVRAALDELGLLSVQTRTGAGDVLFGAVAPEGGCVFGAVEAEAVTVEVGGGIMDGGCLPAQ
jgi:hypothetical protein